MPRRSHRFLRQICWQRVKFQCHHDSVNSVSYKSVPVTNSSNLRTITKAMLNSGGFVLKSLILVGTVSTLVIFYIRCYKNSTVAQTENFYSCFLQDFDKDY